MGFLVLCSLETMGMMFRQEDLQGWIGVFSMRGGKDYFTLQQFNTSLTRIRTIVQCFSDWNWMRVEELDAGLSDFRRY